MLITVYYCIEFGKCDTTDWLPLDVELPEQTIDSSCSDFSECLYDAVERKVLASMPEEDRDLVECGGWIIRIKMCNE